MLRAVFGDVAGEELPKLGYSAYCADFALLIEVEYVRSENHLKEVDQAHRHQRRRVAPVTTLASLAGGFTPFPFGQFRRKVHPDPVQVDRRQKAVRLRYSGRDFRITMATSSVGSRCRYRP